MKNWAFSMEEWIVSTSLLFPINDFMIQCWRQRKNVGDASARGGRF